MDSNCSRSSFDSKTGFFGRPILMGTSVLKKNEARYTPF